MIFTKCVGGFVEESKVYQSSLTLNGGRGYKDFHVKTNNNKKSIKIQESFFFFFFFWPLLFNKKIKQDHFNTGSSVQYNVIPCYAWPIVGENRFKVLLNIVIFITIREPSDYISYSIFNYKIN